MKKRKYGWLVNIVMFLMTFAMCMSAGAFWLKKDPGQIMNWRYGLEYALLIIGFLSAHEFGHYFAARFHKVDSTLPYYIPSPLFAGGELLNPFGTFGAVIKTRKAIPSRKALFDIGVAGPVAGFIVCLIYLIVGLVTLPDIEYLYALEPGYRGLEQIPVQGLAFGDNILFHLLAALFTNPDGFLPPMNNIYHYPLLNVGWFGLFVTSLNMLPIGQLDGGHVVYAMFGARRQFKISKAVWWIMVVIGFGGLLNTMTDLLTMEYSSSFIIFLQDMFREPMLWLRSRLPFYFNCWMGWLVWAGLAKFVVKLKHPPVGSEGEELSPLRRGIGWFALIILLVSFTYNGIYFAGI